MNIKARTAVLIVGGESRVCFNSDPESELRLGRENGRERKDAKIVDGMSKNNIQSIHQKHRDLDHLSPALGIGCYDLPGV